MIYISSDGSFIIFEFVILTFFVLENVLVLLVEDYTFVAAFTTRETKEKMKKKQKIRLISNYVLRE